MRPVSIRSFVADDVAFALAEAQREGWEPTTALLEVCLAHDPDGCFVAEQDDRAVGLVTTTAYARSAWVGHLIVRPEHRRQGVGERLMRCALDHLARRRVDTVRLEADPPGVRLYRRLGFVDEFESLRFARDPGDAPRAAALPRWGPADWPAIAAFDLERFGDDRGRLLALMAARAVAAHGVFAGNTPRGYVLALPTATGARLGPWVAADEETARTLLDAVLTNLSGCRLTVGVPATNPTAQRLLAARGFHRTPASIRMVRGPVASSGRPAEVFGIANGALG